MKIQPPEDLSTYLLLNRIAELLFQIQVIDREQAKRRELLGAFIRLQQQDQGEVREWKN